MSDQGKSETCHLSEEKADFHLHLYGAISASKLFELGKSRHLKFIKRLEWYADEYLKVFGTHPDPVSWWKMDIGYEQFCDHFYVKKTSSFAEFQARFNLIIALFPPIAEDMTLAKTILTEDQLNGGFKEYRTFVPHFLTDSERYDYVVALLTTFHEFSSGQHFMPRVAFSVARDQTISTKMLDWLRFFLEKNPHFQHLVTGVDYSASEDGYPPKYAISQFKRIKQMPFSFEVLYHVGETWDHQGPFSAIRWVTESALGGADRLGHATILGFPISQLKDRCYLESLVEHEDHKTWLTNNANILAEVGYGSTQINHFMQLVHRQRKFSKGHISSRQIYWTIDEEVQENLELFQLACQKIIAKTESKIECLPRSNYLLSPLESLDKHPVFSFLQNNISVLLGSDDPGIFNTSISREWSDLKDTGKLTKPFINQLKKSISNHLKKHNAL